MWSSVQTLILYYRNFLSVSDAIRMCWLYPHRKPPPPKKRMSWVWHQTATSDDSSFEDLGNVEYPFIAIDPKSTLTWSCIS